MPVVLPSSQLTPVSMPTDGDVVLDVPYFSQRPYVNLCWATCCQMILGFYNKIPPGGLNTIVSNVLGVDCANLANCDQVSSPDNANVKMGINCTPFDYPFTMDAILNELNAGRPIEVLLQLNGGQHVLLITGYTAGNLVVLDPWYGHTLIAYDQLLKNYVNGGYWQFTYYNLSA